MMIVTGSINTLATKWADTTPSEGRDGEVRNFNHPFLQAVGMFLGEFSCLFAFKILHVYYTKVKRSSEEELPAMISGSRTFNPLIFLPPAMCDMLATTIMYIGLILTYASSFQMLRGALIVFTGLLSVAFLNRKLKTYEWTGIGVVMLGLAIVGVSDMIGTSDASKPFNNLATGDLLIILAQIITATQMCVEEKFVGGSNVSPLQAVGWEGFFGFFTLGILCIPMYYIDVGNMIFKNPEGRLEDAIDAFYQIKNSPTVAVAFLGTILSISFFNFAGISVTKEISATTRTVLDSVRTLVVWAVSLGIGWQPFSGYQVLGFLVLVCGMFLYNDVIIRQGFYKVMSKFRPDQYPADMGQDTEPIDGPSAENGLSNNGFDEGENGHRKGDPKV
jgi:drug/metabolite transporter (DMT)-like permease